MRTNTNTRVGLGLGALLSVGLVSSLAHAEPPPPPTTTTPSDQNQTPGSAHEIAASSFEQARRAIDAGDCAAALPKLDESLRAEPSIGAHLSYADCFEKIDAYVAFWHLREAALVAFLRHDERHAATEKRAAELVARIAAVRVGTHVGDLDQSDFQLRIDNKPVDRFHLSGPLAVRPGEHTLSASTADGKHWERRINAEIGKVVAVDVQLEDGGANNNNGGRGVRSPLANEAPTDKIEPTKTSSSRGGTQRTIGVLVGGVGLATIAAGAAFGVVTIARRNDLDRACGGSVDDCTGSPRTINPILVSAKNSATASNVLFATGAAVLAGGIVLYLTAPSAATTSSPTTGQKQRQKQERRRWVSIVRNAFEDPSVYRW